MRALNQFVKDYNGWNVLFSKQPKLNLSKPTQAMINQIAEELANNLSPENISCDGELSVRAVAARRRFLNEVEFDLKNFCRVNNFTMPQLVV